MICMQKPQKAELLSLFCFCLQSAAAVMAKAVRERFFVSVMEPQLMQTYDSLNHQSIILLLAVIVQRDML